MIVWKFPLPVKITPSMMVNGPFEIDMPCDASVLVVAMQDNRPTLWALVDPMRATEKRRFLLVGTGNYEVPTRGFSHVGTFQMGGFVGHVFQET